VLVLSQYICALSIASDHTFSIYFLPEFIMCSTICNLHVFASIRIEGDIYILIMTLFLPLAVEDNISMNDPAVCVNVHILM
jgi:hypothetical protein